MPRAVPGRRRPGKRVTFRLRTRVSTMGVRTIAPHHPRRTPKTQNLRELRRYRRRWHVERLFAWMMRCRRLVNRYECEAENFLGFAQVACIVILSKTLRDVF